MKRAVAAGFGVLLVVIAILALQSRGTPPPSAAPTPDGSEVDPLVAPGTSSPGDADVDPLERAELDPATPLESIPGDLIVELVTEGTSTRVPGVGVTVIPRNGRGTLLGLLQQSTDSTGQALFQGLDPGRVDVVVGRLVRTRARIEPDRQAHVRLSVPAGIRIEGQVVGPDGEPVASAQVLYWDLIPDLPFNELPVPVALTDGLGRFTVDPYLRPGQLSATAEGYLPSPRYWPALAEGEPIERFSQATPPTPSADISISLRIELGSQPGLVNGIVVNEEGSPIANALVRTTPPRSRFVQDPDGNSFVNDQAVVRVTGEDGRFLLQVAADTEVTVRAAGHAPHRQPLEVSPGEQIELRVGLLESPGISGVVKSTTGQVLAGVTVGASLGLRLSTQVVTGADGTYDLDDVLIGSPLRVYASHPDHVFQWTTLRVEAGSQTEWNPELESLARLRGRVVDEVGRPLSGWTVQVDPPTQPNRVPYVRVSTETAEDGGFDLAVVRGKPYLPTLREPGQWLSPDLSELGELYGDQPELVIVVDSDMRATSYVRGVLRDDTGQPLDAVSLQLYVGPLTARLQIQTDESGRFEIGPITAHHYKLQVWESPRNLPVMDLIEFDLEPGQELDLGEVTIASQGTLVYSVRGPDGENIAGQLSAFLESDLSTLGTVLMFDREGDGTATVPAGDYTLQVSASGHMKIARNITVIAGGENAINLELFAGDMLRVLPVLPDDAGLAEGEHLEARALHHNGDWTEYSPGIYSEGKLYEGLSHLASTPRPWFLFSVLRPGGYALELTSESGKVFAGTFTVRERTDPEEIITVHCVAR